MGNEELHILGFSLEKASAHAPAPYYVLVVVYILLILLILSIFIGLLSNARGLYLVQVK